MMQVIKDTILNNLIIEHLTQRGKITIEETQAYKAISEKILDKIFEETFNNLKIQIEKQIEEMAQNIETNKQEVDKSQNQEISSEKEITESAQNFNPIHAILKHL